MGCQTGATAGILVPFSVVKKNLLTFLESTVNQCLGRALNTARGPLQMAL